MPLSLNWTSSLLFSHFYRKRYTVTSVLYLRPGVLTCGPNAAHNIIFCGLHKDFVAQCKYLTFKLVLQKIVLQRKNKSSSCNLVKTETIAMMRTFILKNKVFE